MKIHEYQGKEILRRFGVPTAAIQSFAGQMPEERDDGRKPFQLDQCHALETSTETVRRWYPRWYRKLTPVNAGTGRAPDDADR